MRLRIDFTNHYYLYHRQVPKDLVVKVILTGKRKQMGEDLFAFKSRSKKQQLYVLCRLDRKRPCYWVINAKRKRIRK